MPSAERNNMETVIVIIILIVILGTAAGYVYKAKKSGAKCIGCPVEGGCPHKKGGACTCHTDAKP